MRIVLSAALTIVLALITTHPARAQLGEINLLTDLGTPFPPGCLAIDLPDQPPSDDGFLVDSDIAVPSVNSDSRDAQVRVQAWRVACPDDDYSVVLVRMQQIGSGNPIVIPQIYAKVGNISAPFGNSNGQHLAQLQSLPVGGNMGAAGDIVSVFGNTWALAVDPISLEAGDNPTDDQIFTPEEYNDVFTIEMTWESYSQASTRSFRFPLDLFDPALDEPQFEQNILHGRHSGLFLREGAERQGLVLQVAENANGNYLFAIFFTFIDGEAVWVIGNTGSVPMEPGPLTMRVDIPDGGAFMTDEFQPAREDIDMNEAGQITVEPIDCNNIKVDYDFTPIGKGVGTLELFRLIRTAGYDCNPWE